MFVLLLAAVSGSELLDLFRNARAAEVRPARKAGLYEDCFIDADCESNNCVGTENMMCGKAGQGNGLENGYDMAAYANNYYGNNYGNTGNTYYSPGRSLVDRLARRAKYLAEELRH